MVCSFSYDRVEFIFRYVDDGIAEVWVGLINAGCVRKWKVPSKPVGDARVLFPFGFPKVPSLVELTWK